MRVLAAIWMSYCVPVSNMGPNVDGTVPELGTVRAAVSVGLMEDEATPGGQGSAQARLDPRTSLTLYGGTWHTGSYGGSLFGGSIGRQVAELDNLIQITVLGGVGGQLGPSWVEIDEPDGSTSTVRDGLQPFGSVHGGVVWNTPLSPRWRFYNGGLLIIQADLAESWTFVHVQPVAGFTLRPGPPDHRLLFGAEVVADVFTGKRSVNARFGAQLRFSIDIGRPRDD